MSLLDQLEDDMAAILHNEEDFAEPFTINGDAENTITGIFGLANQDATLGQTPITYSGPSLIVTQADVTATGLIQSDTLTRQRTGIDYLVDRVPPAEIDGSVTLMISEA